ncbi:Gfo/Idh/MocA family protein [Planctomicrobium piriforme]|uniref:Predicted dehydrogenase n=1 Tax=Planctomicrobium piriforme TaxID=1576369 RepID=A0A1I3IK44_9PLAN|nr:Gfo/Idh/MocA family oxidoreductase [Planctomicrobium piriforme]SFI48395.1 Predicted dehydrogenase [Planctomicrobium piriforme]
MTTHSDRIRVAVVGVGALGRHHARILSQMPEAELVAVADGNQQQGESVAASCGCAWTPDYRTLLSSVDAVSIVVPTSLHRPIAEDFLCRSVPVLVEKPLTANVEDGAVLVRLAREHSVPLQVGHIERFNPAFQKTADLVRNPKYIRCERVSPYAFRSMDIGAVHDLMIHDIELVLALVGETPSQVDAFGVTLVGGMEDCVQARLTFPGGCVADITANRVAPQATRSLQCWSETGCVIADLNARTIMSFTPGEPMLRGDLPFELVQQKRCDAAALKPEIFTRFIKQEKMNTSDEDALTAELRSFLHCIRTGQAPLVSGQQGLAALKVAERVLQAVQSHAWDGTAAGRCGPDALLRHYLPAAQAQSEAA